MLRFICLAALLCAALPAHAESPPTPMCACAAEETCWESMQFCVATADICEHSDACGPGRVCDRRDGDAAVPGRCVELEPSCDADTDCRADQLCSGDAAALPACAEGDAACAAARAPVCGWPILCDDADPDACPAEKICVQQRCTAPDLADAVAAIDADDAQIAAYRDQGRFGHDDEHCAAAPGRPTGSGLALLGVALALGLRRRR